MLENKEPHDKTSRTNEEDEEVDDNGEDDKDDEDNDDGENKTDDNLFLDHAGFSFSLGSSNKIIFKSKCSTKCSPVVHDVKI